MKNETMTGTDILEACERVSSQAEVSGIEREYSSIEYSPVKTVGGTGFRRGWGLRMTRNGKLGVSGQWGNVLPFELVDRAISSCRYGPESTFGFPSVSPVSPPGVPDTMASLTHEEVKDYLHDIRQGVRSRAPEAALTARITWGTDHILLMNSAGLRASYTKTRSFTSLTVTVPSSEGLLQSGCTIETSCSLPGANDVVEMLSMPVSFPGLSPGSAVGRKRVVFSPLAFSVMLQGIRRGVSGRLLARGASPLEGMEGKGVLSPLLTIRDMPDLANGAAWAPFDSEGVPARNKTLFKKGIFQGFIHDLASAAATGEASTGSSGRNLGEHSRPVCTNLVVDHSGEASSDTLAETGSGLLVTDILSAGGGDAGSGQFTFDCGRVYLFRRGEICGYYDGCVISGNLYDALSRVITTGGKKYRCGSDILPFISLDGVSVR